MSKDISSALAGWQFDPERMNVRIVTGDDGRDKIQLRLDLGLMQMEFQGRPDGERIEGFDSWLEWYVARQKEHDAAHPDGPPLLLESEDCLKLLREGVQYYHRYLSFWHLRRFELCARDTARNLKLFAFVKEHARNDRDKLQFDQWRPYVTMMHARAVATPLVELRDVPAAIAAIDAGIAAITQFLEEYEQSHQADKCAELVQLTRWREELSAGPGAPLLLGAAKEPVDAVREELERAIREERFEDAAKLRDELRKLLGEMTPPLGPM
jgi:hypothetical protein